MAPMRATPPRMPAAAASEVGTLIPDEALDPKDPGEAKAELDIGFLTCVPDACHQVASEGSNLKM